MANGTAFASSVAAAILLLTHGLRPATAFRPPSSTSQLVISRHSRESTAQHGWFDNIFPRADDESVAAADAERRLRYPEQYPATYELSDEALTCDDADAQLVRPLLEQTQLETRPLQLAYDASKHGWDPKSFHECVDGKGAAIVLLETEAGEVGGGYNPKGWSSNGGARPSVAAFLYYTKADGAFQKLRKVGGGGLACARDDPTFGISLGPDGLVIGLQLDRPNFAQSKLGPYYERGPEERGSMFEGGTATLVMLKVLVGIYKEGEEIPYSGAVLDMTSG